MARYISFFTAARTLVAIPVVQLVAHAAAAPALTSIPEMTCVARMPTALAQTGEQYNKSAHPSQ